MEAWQPTRRTRTARSFLARYWQSFLPALLVIALFVAAVITTLVSGADTAPSVFKTGTLPRLTSAIHDSKMHSEPSPELLGPPAPDLGSYQKAFRADQIDARVLAARVSWAQTAFLVIIGAVGAIVVAVYVICARKMSHRAKYYVLIAVAVLAVISSQLPDLSPPLFRSLLFESFEAAYAHSVETLTTYLNAAAFLAVLLVTAAACATLVESANVTTLKAPQLVLSLRRLQLLLYLSAALLSVGTHEIASLYSWPAAWFPDTVAKDIQTLAIAVSTAMGTFFSVTLLAVFIPSAALLLSRGRAIGRTTLGDAASEQSVDTWMIQNGLTGFGTQSFSILGAALAPFLVGGPLSILGNRIIG